MKKQIQFVCFMVIFVGVMSVVCGAAEEKKKKSVDKTAMSTRDVSVVQASKTPRKRRNKKKGGVSRQSLAKEEKPVLTNIFRPSLTEQRQTQCKEIPPQLTLCYGIEYSVMHFPNLLGHDTMQELLRQSNEWTPLLNTRCHPDVRKFLCSVFTPVCVKDFKPIPPCRSLCEAVRDGCTPDMARFSFPWPKMLECSQFPEDNNLCIRLQSEGPFAGSTTLPTATKTCAPCRQKKITSSLKRKICSFDFVMKVRIKSVVHHKGNIKLLVQRKSRVIYKWLDQTEPKSISRKVARKSVIWMQDGMDCTCDVLDGVHSHLVTGWKNGNKLILHTVTRWRKTDRKLIKLLRKKNCAMQFAKNKRSEQSQ